MQEETLSRFSKPKIDHYRPSDFDRMAFFVKKIKKIFRIPFEYKFTFG